MKKFFAHYTFIYPAVFLKNHVVEQDADGSIVKYYPFERETATTEFHSGLQLFIPYGLKEDAARRECLKQEPASKSLLDDALVRRFRV